MPHLRSCLLVAEVAIVAGAVTGAVVRLVALLRRDGAYGLSDALGAGVLGGVLGAALGAALCVARDGPAHPGGGWPGAWAARFFPFGGLALVEGAVLGVAAAYAVARLSARAGKPGEPDSSA